MKQIFYFAAFVISVIFASCGENNDTSVLHTDVKETIYYDFNSDIDVIMFNRLNGEYSDYGYSVLLMEEYIQINSESFLGYWDEDTFICEDGTTITVTADELNIFWSGDIPTTILN